ncbi:MAG: phosphoribosylformylglycinamidine synthase [Oscillospiraceae bacterium]|jgi:phosphoribosylformylglycinamidine synthase|nr:phosphoribosylformylglycinamidine synthase [Oscillospiraceae bacterium]
MKNQVFRIFVEKKPGHDVAARSLLRDITGFLGVSLTGLRLFLRYDAQGVSEEGFERCLPAVFSDPPADSVYREHLPSLSEGARLVAYEALPGQFDMRADSCEQCIQFLLGGERPLVRCAAVLVLDGADEAAAERITDYLVNPVECRLASLDKPETLERQYPSPAKTPVLDGFTALDDKGIPAFIEQYGLAMDEADARFLQEYFRSEKRDPTLAEVRVLDTYWSDHCRHTTFLTELTHVNIDDSRVREAYELFLSVHGADRPVTLMGIATAAMKHMRQEGLLPQLDLSEEVNACSVKVTVDTEAGAQPWLLMFKNETHNHPTEIEPFGGAATCIGGAIRDPLSGRSYVYQAMRVTGAADPRAPFADTLPGKLPQRLLTTTAAAGYSSYGNQIGVTAGFVREIYHPGYAAKRMELGAVTGAAPAHHVVRKEPQPGDVVLLLGGATGRDGIGGAVGSSKAQGMDSAVECSAEVQKGNAPEERKIQRLFRKERVARFIKRCNDFGAGGVSVAVGELADGLRVYLDRVPVKYGGLSGTELALSESQERMAVVIAPEDASAFCLEADKENLNCTMIAEVTAEGRLVMEWGGEEIVSLSRDFLNSAGARKTMPASVKPPVPSKQLPWEDMSLSPSERLLLLASDLNFCSQQGLTELFDASAGAGNVLAPYGGLAGAAPEQVSAMLIPAAGSRTASVMACAFDPNISDPFGSAVFSVVTSVAKLAAAGCALKDVHLSLQEYFPRPGKDAERWGWPLAAMLGAFWAQMGLSVAAIGGKDSMSGTFEGENGRIDVPPTLVSFAVAAAPAARIVSSHFTRHGSTVYLMETPVRPDGFPDLTGLRSMWERLHGYICRGAVLSAYACEMGGAAGALAHMSLSGLGVCVNPEHYDEEFFTTPWGGIVFESPQRLEGERVIGVVQQKAELRLGSDFIPIDSLYTAWWKPLESVFPTEAPEREDRQIPVLEHIKRAPPPVHLLNARPLAVIPVFPGTNGEYDMAAALESAGAMTDTLVVRNLRADWLEQSADALEKALRKAQMLVLPGGASGGDEPCGSGRFIAAFLRNPRLADAVRDLLHRRGGLILGVGSGFQALVKLGLVPYGDIREIDEGHPALTINAIGRHQARYVHTRVSSVLSPWLMRCAPGEIHTVPVSHGEGRFTASDFICESLIRGGQIAFQYSDVKGNPSMATFVNPNGSVLAAEGVTSPDGRVLGKMAHSERAGFYVGKNIPGNKQQPIFEGGVRYFR